MTPPELLQTIIGLVAVGGIGGVWFRLGSLTAKTDGLDQRLGKVDQRVGKLEGKVSHASIFGH